MPFRRITCPHCIREVSVSADVTCPACSGNTAERNAETDGLSLVEFVDGEKLPPLCVLCASSAGHFVEIGERHEPVRRDAWFSLSRLLGALGGLIAIENEPEPSARGFKIAVRLPVCDRHRQSRYLRPTHVDYERYRITVPAHRKFIEQWKQAKPPE